MIETYQEQFNEYKSKFNSVLGTLNKDILVKNLENLNTQLMNSSVYMDLDKSKTLLKQKAIIEVSLEKIQKVETMLADFTVAIELAISGDDTIIKELESISKKCKERIRNYK